MKKIVIDGVIFSLQKAGGISRLWAEILLGLNRSLALDHEVTLLLPTNQNIEWQGIKEELKNITVIKRERFRFGKTRFFKDSLILTLLALKLRPDVWHSSYYVGLPFFPRLKKIVTCHDMIGEKFKLAAPYETRLKYASLKGADTIVVPSKHSESDLCAFWPEFKGKTTLIFNGSSGVMRKGHVKNAPYFVFVGKRRGYKNFLPVAKTILNHPDFVSYRIKVVGGEGELTLEESALKERVDYLGILSSEQVEELIAHATLLLFPSLYEGFGMPVLEAFQQGVPVLGMRTSSIVEVAGDHYPLAAPDDAESLFLTLKTLIKEREKWIEYGKERQKLFTCEKMVSALMNHYL